jgi:hypothetical protein
VYLAALYRITFSAASVSGPTPVRRISRHSPAISSRPITAHNGRARARYAAGRPLVANNDRAAPTASARALAGAPTFEEIASQVGALLSRRVLVAHNAQFDYDFLAHEFAHVRSWVPVGSRLCTLALNRLAGPAGHRVSRHGSALSDTWALRPSRLAPVAPAVPDLGGSPRPGGNDGVGIVGFLLGDMGSSRETKGAAMPR